jgi:predicted adenylyl cyclase CyaB
METLLAASVGVRGVVSKTRYLYIVGHTRVHLDEVEGLGRFLELESVLGPDHGEDEGQRAVSELMAKLGIAEDDLIHVAYIDLLELVRA